MSSRLLISYNIQPEHQKSYLQFAINTFIPTLQSLGLVNAGVWHTAYGNYPIRLLVFSADDKATMKRILSSETWLEMEKKLKTYVTDYSRRVIESDSRFQF